MHHSKVELANNLLTNLRVAVAERDRIVRRLPEIIKEIDSLRLRCIEIGIDVGPESQS